MHEGLGQLCDFMAAERRMRGPRPLEEEAPRSEERPGDLETRRPLTHLLVDELLAQLRQPSPARLDAWTETHRPSGTQAIGLGQLKHDISSARTELIALLRRAGEAGLTEAWEGLSRIIAFLEGISASWMRSAADELAEAHRALQRSEERFKQLYRSVPIMTHSSNAAQEIIEISDLWLERLGYTRDEIVGRNSPSLMPPAAREAMRDSILPQLFEHGVFRDAPLQIARKDGALLDILCNGILIRDAAGAPLYSIVVAFDVTDELRTRRSFETISREAQAQRDALRTQQEVLRQLQSPLIPVAEGVLVMPLIGALDDARAAHVLEVLLDGVSRHRAAVAILDVTGVPQLDEIAASAIARATQAARLLGAEVVLTGIQPGAARALVELGVDPRHATIRATLQEGILHATRRRTR